ncbi:uncharacterized protein B0T23DRAFT_180491 [Neurospora hispaniola]|uniref:Uncharacterized protein n=1 Tax=Neurospora hispaniola TaxID=588809 RepID=A0AAJ0I6Z4_9PEZI|nr:hypothetical protein B0T23DRAFT_180491 [Neurospora hispaniola]
MESLVYGLFHSVAWSLNRGSTGPIAKFEHLHRHRRLHKFGETTSTTTLPGRVHSVAVRRQASHIFLSSCAHTRMRHPFFSFLVSTTVAYYCTRKLLRHSATSLFTSHFAPSSLYTFDDYRFNSFNTSPLCATFSYIAVCLSLHHRSYHHRPCPRSSLFPKASR